MHLYDLVLSLKKYSVTEWPKYNIIANSTEIWFVTELFRIKMETMVIEIIMITIYSNYDPDDNIKNNDINQNNSDQDDNDRNDNDDIMFK